MENERETIRAIMTRIALLSPKERADALEKWMVLAGLRQLETVVKEEVEEMAISIDVMENAFLRDIFMKGRQEGEQTGEATMLLTLLRCKFGQIAESVAVQVTGADRERLEQWSKKLLFANSLDDVFAA
ncbi:MAG: DUF4351 domain-containing protein [Magnetococcales bacterium]|nr:DUF4351 domain-containing protein [Magnetococcales bacterium]